MHTEFQKFVMPISLPGKPINQVFWTAICERERSLNLFRYTVPYDKLYSFYPLGKRNPCNNNSDMFCLATNLNTLNFDRWRESYPSQRVQSARQSIEHGRRDIERHTNELDQELMRYKEEKRVIKQRQDSYRRAQTADCRSSHFQSCFAAL